jgi:thioredoxin-like negative regulator of GroEL
MSWRPIDIEYGENGRVVRIHWGRLIAFFLAFLVTGWLAAALAAWAFVKYYRQFSDVRYADLLLPGRWPAYRISEGNYYIAHAGQLLQQGETGLALYQLRSGVAKSPANAKGRTDLASLYLAYRRPDLAREVLVDGIRYLSSDPAYLQSTMSFLLEFHEDARLQEVADQVLASTSAPDSRNLAALFAALAAYYRGNFDRAEDLIGTHHLRESADGATLLARIEWERGYPELAILHLQQLLARQPAQDGARALLAGYYRSLGRTSELESAIVERLVSDPLAPAPHLEYLYLYHQRGDRPRLAHETETYLAQFQNDSAALLLLADFAANTGQPALARRVQQIFTRRHENNGAPALMVAEACIVAGEYQAALGLIADYQRDFPEWTGQFATIFNGLQAVALSGLGKKDEARLYLDNLLAQKNLRADNLVAVANRLTTLGARDLALSALARATEADPLNEAALASLVRLELDSGSFGDLPAHLAQFMHTRKPSHDILTRAYAVLGSDRFLFLPAQGEQLAALRTALTPHRP